MKVNWLGIKTLRTEQRNIAIHILVGNPERRGPLEK
jgi:hypothetical protein